MRSTSHLLLLTIAAAFLAACSGAPPLSLEDARIREGRELYDRSDFERAQKHFQSLLAEAEASGETLVQAQAQKWLGNILLAYEQPDDAITWYERSLSLLNAGIEKAGVEGNEPAAIWLDERENVLSNTAVVYKNRRQFEEAADLFRRVLSQDSARGDRHRVAVSLYNLGDVYHQWGVAAGNRKDTARFVVLQQNARQLFLQSLSAAPTADAWLNLGNNYAVTYQLDSAVYAYRQAETIYGQKGYRVHRALALGNIGVLSIWRRHSAEAAEALKNSISIIEELRGNLSSIDVRSSFVSDKFYIYENLIGILVDTGHVEEAFEYVERAKARSFLDMIGNKAIGSGKDRRPEVQVLIEEERQLQKRIADLMTVPDSAAVLGNVIARHREVIGWLREKDPEYASVKSIDPVPVKELQGMLDDSTALLEYFIGERSSFVFLVRHDTLLARRLNLKSKELARDVEALRRLLFYDFPMRKTGFLREQRLRENKSMLEALEAWRESVTDNSWQFKLMEMHSRLIFPVQPSLKGIRNLYVVPHGPLHHLPFQALVPPTGVDFRGDVHIARPKYMIEEYALSYLPSASVLGFAMKKDAHPAMSAMIVGDPVYADPKYRRRPLDGALIEADTVARYARDPLLLKREQAEEKTVKERIGQNDLLHFATHGELNKKDPLQSRILLAAMQPDSINDGNLTVSKIFNLDLNAVLVTLSACQTAQLASEEGGFTPGDDLVGLTRSFMYAGTPSVIASLWYVDDAATLDWMRAFYQSWLDAGVSRMRSAREAALQMLDQPKDPDWIFPYYWSAFVYMGDSR